MISSYSWVTEAIRRLAELTRGHKKIISYASPGAEAFYRKLGFPHMNTAMAIWTTRHAPSKPAC